MTKLLSASQKGFSSIKLVILAITTQFNGKNEDMYNTKALLILYKKTISVSNASCHRALSLAHTVRFFHGYFIILYVKLGSFLQIRLELCLF
jgi:hypothetical protein